MSPQAGWILQSEVVPRLRASIPRNVSRVGAEDDEELVQDATVMAAKLMDRLERHGKQVTPGNIAYYTILHMKSGRRSQGTTSTDACGVGTQIAGRSRLGSLDEPAKTEEIGDEIFTVNDVFSNDSEDPAQLVARKLDWEAFSAELTGCEQALIEALLTGRNLSAVATRFRVSYATLRTIKRRLADRILDYMGPDILKEIRRLPNWRQDLDTNREQLACRQDRRN